MRRARSAGRCAGRPTAARTSCPPSHGRDVASHAELALDRDGKALALRVRSRANVGAYATPAGVAIQLLIGPWVIDQHLRHREHRPAPERGPHQHHADGRLPRRRPPGGDLPDRAAVRRRRARDEDRPGRAAPAQHDPARADAVQERDGPDLRQRRVREDPGPGARARRLERLRRAPRRFGPRAASCAAAASPRSSNGPAATCSRKRSASTSPPTAWSRSSRRRRRWARASRPAMPSSRSTCSACRSRRSASSRATPTAATASAAPARARSSPAARR